MTKIVLAACAVALFTAVRLPAQQDATPTRAERFERDGIIWGSPDVWSAPYAENLSDDLKLAGLSRLWMEVKINFPNFGKIAEVDWDKVYVEYIAKVRATTSTYAYYQELQRMSALLRDGHSGVFLPKELTERLEADVPLQIEQIEQRVFVTRVASRALELAGIMKGLEIVTIDGIPVHEYVAIHRRPFASSNSPQHREVVAFSYGLLAGPRDRPVTVQFRTAAGRLFATALARTPYADAVPIPHVEFLRLAHNLAYVAINTFGSEDVQKEFEKFLPEIRRCDGLIIDVRQNDGGSGVLAYNIIGDLTDKPFTTSAARTRRYTATLRTWGQAGAWHAIPAPVWNASPDNFFAKPVVMLIGPKAVSATDVFAETFQRVHRGSLVGEPTAGSIGDPLVFALPGGGMARVATSTDPGGGLVGRGVLPDVQVSRTIVDFLAGRDAALERGIAELRAAIARTGP